jgi:hypothetical protein
MFGIRENSKPIRSRQTGSVDPPQHGFGWSSLRLGPDQLATVAADDELFFLFEKQWIFKHHKLFKSALHDFVATIFGRGPIYVDARWKTCKNVSKSDKVAV